MANVNKVILIGNLTRDPELRYLPSQMAVVDFSLAVNRTWRSADGEKKEEVCFIECSCFGKPAEIINQYVSKGKQLYVEGHLKLESWEDKQGGGKRSKHKVIVDNFQFLGGRDDEGGGGGGAAPRRASSDRSGGGDYGGGGGSGGGGYGNRPARGAGRPQQSPQQPADAPYSDQEQHFGEDEIPF